MEKSVSAEHLERIHCCAECKSVFLFMSDVEDHQEMYGHRKKMYEVPFDSITR